MKIIVPDKFKTALQISSNWKLISTFCRFYALRGSTLYISCLSEHRTILEHERQNLILKVNVLLGWQCVEKIKFIYKELEA